ncbi:MAG TPA: DUF4167 domain-containing protein [Sphingomonadales bacterium]
MGGANNRPNANNNNHGHGNNGRMRRPQNLLNRQIESNGPEGKVRGTALQLYERYKNSAREVQSSDRILAESFLQFAEHYYRLAAEYGAFDHEPPRRDEDLNIQDDQELAIDEPAHEEAAPEAVVPADDEAVEEQPAALAAPVAEPEPAVEPAAADGEQPSFLFDGEDAAPRLAANGEEAAPARRRSTAARAEAAPVTGRLSLNRGNADADEGADAGDDPHTPAFLKVEVRRRRGRPRKDEAASADAASSAEAPAAADGVNGAAADADEAAAPAPRRRGRPRKTAVEAPAVETAGDKATA